MEYLSHHYVKLIYKLHFLELLFIVFQVVYAPLVEDDHYHRLLDLAECVRSVFSECQVCMPDTRTLHPHLTIAKLSKAPRVKGKVGFAANDTSFKSRTW